jgi:hypothetical protein
MKAKIAIPLMCISTIIATMLLAVMWSQIFYFLLNTIPSTLSKTEGLHFMMIFGLQYTLITMVGGWSGCLDYKSPIQFLSGLTFFLLSPLMSATYILYGNTL